MLYRTVRILAITTAVIAVVATLAGLFSRETIISTTRIISMHGREVVLDGRGLYRHMPADVAVQGRAQDVITLLVAIPLLVTMAFKSRKASSRNRLILAGTLPPL